MAEESSIPKLITSGRIYKNGVRYGGVCSGIASDTYLINADTIFSSTNVQGALSEISNMFEPGNDAEGGITNISVGINPTTRKLGLVVKWKQPDGTGNYVNKINYIDFTNA